MHSDFSIHVPSKVYGHVSLHLIDAASGKIVDVRETRNLVTTAGLRHYIEALDAEQGHGSNAMTNDFDTIVLGTGGAGPALSSTMSNITVADSTGLIACADPYPTRDCPNADGTISSINTGGGDYVFTWHAEWAAGVYTQTIDRVAITINGAAFNGSSPLMSYATISPVPKTSGQALKVFINHTIS